MNAPSPLSPSVGKAGRFGTHLSSTQLPNRVPGRGSLTGHSPTNSTRPEWRGNDTSVRPVRNRFR